MAAVRLLNSKNCQFCHVTLVGMPFCFLTQNLDEIGLSVDEIWPKKAIFSMAVAAMLNFKISIFGHVTVPGFNICCSGPIFIKIGRYGDLAMCKMAAVRHLGFVVTSQYCIAGHIFVVQILS